MPRPQRCRRVCEEPEYNCFYPGGIPCKEEIKLSVDEYETIRLVDLNGLNHADASKQMDISRTTLTEIYNSARKKIADSIVNGKRLVVSGGNYRLCDGGCESFCIKHNKKFSDKKIVLKKKGKNIMRIAIAYENGKVFQHFGHTEEFKFYDVDEGLIVNAEVISTNGKGHGALAGFLSENGADVLICGGIGGGAQKALAEADIKLYGGVSGDVEKAVDAFLTGNLEYNPDVKCNHHSEDHECTCH